MAATTARGAVLLLALALPGCAILFPGSDDATCTVGGISHKLNTSWPAADGCGSQCVCTSAGTFTCTPQACDPPTTCIVNGETWRIGAEFDAADGCNRCQCGSGGVVTCTRNVCPGPQCHVGGVTYQPNDTVIVGAQTCKCLDDGTVGNCTQLGGAGCNSGGNLYQVGDSFTDARGLPCSCVAPATVRCPDAGPGTCRFDDHDIPPGTVVDLPDGCNHCTCQPGGALLCSDASCEVVENFTDPGPPPISVLFVVSDTGDAASLQTGIADHAGDLFAAIEASGATKTIAVTSTAMQPEASCPAGAVVESGRITPVDGSRPRLLRDTTKSWQTIFRQNLQVGTCHQKEWGLQAAAAALTVPLINADNAGLVPAGSRIAVVFATTHDDSSLGDVANYVRAIVSSVDPLRPDLVSAHALLGGDCSQSGDRYAQVAGLLEGHARYVCGGWGTAAADLGLDLAAYESHFALANVPYDRSGDGLITEGAGEISVLVNGEKIPATSGPRLNWRYDYASNALVFPRTAVPGKGTAVEVHYLAPPPSVKAP